MIRIRLKKYGEYFNKEKKTLSCFSRHFPQKSCKGCKYPAHFAFSKSLSSKCFHSAQPLVLLFPEAPGLFLLLLLVLAPSPSLCQDKRSIAFSDGTAAKPVANREDSDIGAARAAAEAAKRALAAGEHQVYLCLFSHLNHPPVCFCQIDGLSLKFVLYFLSAEDQVRAGAEACQGRGEGVRDILG